jgi:folate-binding protein YgfZ
MSRGAARRPVLEMVQPSAVRATEICSTPSGAPRTKIVKLDVPAGAIGGATGCCCAPTTGVNATAAAKPHPRIKWLERMSQHNTAIPGVSPRGYEAARRHAAFFERGSRARIVVSGRDRASYLHGLLTNDIATLAAGEGRYAAYLTPQGRMIADLFVYELGDVMLLVVPGETKDTVLANFDRFIFSEDVQLGDVTNTFAQIAVVGPDAAHAAAAAMNGVDANRLQQLPEHGNIRAEFRGRPAIITRVTDTGEAGYDLFVEREQAGVLFDVLGAEPIAAVPLDAEAVEALRIEAGVPLFGRDMDQDTIPLEAGIESRAISFSKGCYVGQEVIIRVMHRGHGRVAKKLVGLTLDADVVPARGALIRADDREVGLVTSSTFSPALNRPIALGYAHRDFTAAGTALTIDGLRATVTQLPFVGQQ